jgi:hypothetical protein
MDIVGVSGGIGVSHGVGVALGVGVETRKSNEEKLIYEQEYEFNVFNKTDLLINNTESDKSQIRLSNNERAKNINMSNNNIFNNNNNIISNNVNEINYTNNANDANDANIIIEEEKVDKTKRFEISYNNYGEHKNYNDREIKEIKIKVEPKFENQIINYQIRENEIILLFFINPDCGSNDGKKILNMGVKKVEFVDSLMCAAHIFNIKDKNNLEYGKFILNSEIKRGKIVLVKFKLKR